MGTRRSLAPAKIRDGDGAANGGEEPLSAVGKRERKPAHPWSPDVAAAQQQLLTSDRRGSGRASTTTSKTGSSSSSPKKRSSIGPPNNKPVVLVRGPGGRFISPGSTSASPVKKRGPGRPPKNEPDTASGKRGPGRPSKKSSKKKEQKGDRKRKRDTLSSPSRPKKRGRPPKNKLASEASKRRGPGRPLKSETDAAPTAGDDAVMTTKTLEPQVPVKVSRSGRMVKRNKHHDEIAEGEQHLRSDRPLRYPNKQGSEDGSTSSFEMVDLETQENERARSTSAEDADVPPARKKQKVEGLKVVTKLAETKDGKDGEKDDDTTMSEEPPLAPVRMKTVVQPSTPVRVTLMTASVPSVPENMVALEGFDPTNASANVPAIEAPPVLEIRGKIVQSKLPVVVVAPPKQPETVPVVEDSKPAAIPLQSVKTNTAAQSVANTINATVPVDTAITAKVPAPLTGLTGPAPLAAPPASTIAKDATTTNYPSTPLLDPKALEAAVKALPDTDPKEEEAPRPVGAGRAPRRKPGARECIQMSRRFGANVIPERQMNMMLDYCSRGKVEHLIRMRERLDDHSRFLEHQLAGLEMLVLERGESKIVVPAVPERSVDPFRRGIPPSRTPSPGFAPAPFAATAKVAAKSTAKEGPTTLQDVPE